MNKPQIFESIGSFESEGWGCVIIFEMDFSVHFIEQIHYTYILFFMVLTVHKRFWQLLHIRPDEVR